MVLNSNFRLWTKMSDQLDHSKMNVWLCAKPVASDIFPGSDVLRNWSQILEFCNFPKPKGPLPENNSFLTFLDFFSLGVPWKLFHGVCVSKYFFGPNYLNFNLCFGHEPPRWIIPFSKKSKHKISRNSQNPLGFCNPTCMGLPWKF